MQPGETWAELGGGLVVCRTGPEHAEGLEALQRLAFPTLADQQRFKAAHYRHHVALFAEGQFCAVDRATGQIVGMTTTLRLDFDLDHPDHTFAQIFGEGWLPLHRPDGRWLYGADIGTHPAYRRRGIARALYAARHDTVRRLGLAGQVTVGSLSGYGALAGEMTAEAYYAELRAGARADPTISAQLRVGFLMRGLIRGYLEDPVCAGHGVLLLLPAESEVPLPS
jgi:GNAT superfamily N-acetyltransferase